MTEAIEARRSERVHYRGPVELCTREGVADADSVQAEVVDLGAGGMRVFAKVGVPVGAHVTCRVALDGRDAALPGRVAWLTDGDHLEGIGIGICFDPLGSDEAALLAHVVERSRQGYRSIELRFADDGPRVQARARARTGGLRLSAMLPILARGTELSFRLDEEGPQFTGRVADASLHEESGARRLEVDVDVLDGDSVRFRRRARYGYADEIEAGDQRERALSAPSALPAGLHEVAARLRAGKSRAAKLAALLFAAACGGLLGWSAAQLPGPPPASASSAAATPVASTALAPRPARPASATAPAAVSAATPGAAMQPEAAMLQPEVQVDGDVTRVLLPFEGDLAQMNARLWAQPFALAVDLPQGRTRLAEGSYPLYAGSAEHLRVQRRDGADLVRLTLSVPLARYAVAVQNGTLELRLVRHPVLAPNL